MDFSSQRTSVICLAMLIPIAGHAIIYCVHVEQPHVDHTIIIDDDLASAVSKADIVQEQGPENESFKTNLWPRVEQHCPHRALLWSSTSGIPASVQNIGMRDPSRLIVVHPYNPPHIMPLLEIVPSPVTDPEVITRTLEFWKQRGKTPIVLKKETIGFVANRLAFALLREAIYLVNEGVASVKDIDDLMTGSMGPRWAAAGIFKSYHTGGGVGGLEAFFKNIGETVQACWDDSGTVNVNEGWREHLSTNRRDLWNCRYGRARQKYKAGFRGGEKLKVMAAKRWYAMQLWFLRHHIIRMRQSTVIGTA